MEEPHRAHVQGEFSPTVDSSSVDISDTSIDAKAKCEPASSPLSRSVATTPTQGPILTDETKCRHCWSHMTPLYSQNRLTHKYADQSGSIYPITTQYIPAWPKQPPSPPHIPFTTRIRRVSSTKTGGHFVKACAEKKEGRLRSFKN